MCARAARLHLEESRPTLHFDDPARGITNRALPAFRLQIRFDVVNSATELDGIPTFAHVATDEPFSVFPNDAWYPFADRISWLHQPPRFPHPLPWLYRGNHSFELGLIWASVWDAPAPDVDSPVRRLRACRMLALFLRDNLSDLRHGRIGLRYSLLTGRKIACEQDYNDEPNHHERWWLEEFAR